jgi:hypothetical protein
VVLVLVVGGFLVLALGGVGGYLYLKKKGASWRDLLHKGQVAAEMQQEQQPAEGEAQPQEEPQPSYGEEAQPEEQPQQPSEEEAQPQPPAEEPSAPAPKRAPSKPKPSPAPVEAPQAVPPPQFQPPAEEQPAPQAEAAPKVKKTSFGIIFESSAYVTKLVVKVDGEKQFEQALSPTGSKMRVEKTLLVPEGPHHIRVAMWRAQGDPIAQEWDFTFEHGQNPAFKVELSNNWQPTLKRLQ